MCIVAYGQTGSGKTYTMMGPNGDSGVNKRAVSELFQLLESSKDTLESTISVSMMEVYNENVFDLLAKGKSREDAKRRLRQTPRGVEIVGLIERDLTKETDIWQTFQEGEKNRTIRATSMNAMSSRSHLLLRIRVATKNIISGVKTNACLTLVDLAGSERVRKSEVTGVGLKEAAAVNKSLSALGLVFLAIQRGNSYIPFKNSCLTQLLASSLSNNAKCVMFVNVSPKETELAETLSSLRFAGTVAKVELGKAQKKMS